MSILRRALLLVAVTYSAGLAAQNISTVAGGDTTGPIDALAAALREPVGVAVDGAGNRYIASSANNRVYKVDASGVLTVLAGNGNYGFSGDGGPASAARLASPYAVALDATDNLYISDHGNQRIRRVDRATGSISTMAGNGSAGFGGDGGPAISASLSYPRGIDVDATGNLYIADYENQRIRKVSATTGLITTVAGNAVGGFAGDNGPATSANLLFPVDVSVDGSGNVYIADTANNRIRRVDADTGFISTIVGDGTAGFSGDGGSATDASLAFPRGIDLDTAGNLFVADTGNNRVRRIETATGNIATVAGSGTFGFGGDGGLAVSASFNYPYDVAVDTGGNLHIADRDNGRIRKVAAGSISTVAGGAIGDGQLATVAYLNAPWDSARDSSGNLYIADRENRRIRKVDAVTGVMSTVAGNGNFGFAGDGVSATATSLNCPSGVDIDAAGNLYIADTCNNRIRKVTVASGLISTVAGDGSFAFGGDGGPATSAALYSPYDVAVDHVGNIYVMDQGNYRVRKISAATGIISTVAGNGLPGFSGDGGLATNAALGFALGVAVDRHGNIYIVDTGNNRVRKVDATTSFIDTVAGDGNFGFSGDGGLAVNARLYGPYDVAVDAADALFIADLGNGRVRKVSALNQEISTVAGNGNFGFSGDGGPATDASFAFLIGVDIDDAGNLFVADLNNGRIRFVPALGAPIDITAPVVTPIIAGTLGNGGWYVSDVTLSWVVDDSESPVTSKSGCETQTVTEDTAGVTFTCSAASLGGTASASATISRDATKPTIDIATPNGGFYLLHATVSAGYTCSDALSTISTCSGTVPTGSSLNTSMAGTFTFSVAATDLAGNSASASGTYTVGFGFFGFLQPIDNIPIVNSANAGRAIPVKWQLKDANGAYLSSLATFRSLGSYQVSCEAGGATDTIEELAATGGAILRYDAISNDFIYNWSTAANWKGKCRRLVLELADGQKKEAGFRFK